MNTHFGVMFLPPVEELN